MQVKEIMTKSPRTVTPETGLLEVRLSGPDIDVLNEQAEQLMATLAGIPGTIDIKQDWNNRVIVGKADVDQTRARRAGVRAWSDGKLVQLQGLQDRR